MAPVTWRAEGILEKAVSAFKVRDFERAAALCVSAIRVKPDFAHAYAVRGACLIALQQPFDAVLNCERALDLDPNLHDAWNNLGIGFSQIGLWESARQAYQKSLELCKAPEPHIMCGGMFAHLMQLEAAENEFKAALEIEPTNHDSHVKLGVIQLGLGKWAEAFKNYEWRWYDTPYPPKAMRDYPKWKGECLIGRRILLFAEQGFGDEIMSLRFARLLQEQGAHVVLEVRPSIYVLAKTLHKDIIVVAHGDEYPRGIAYSCPLLDVPMVLGLTPETVPYKEGYLKAEKWPGVLPAGLNVGFCWSSGRRPLQPETEKSAEAKSLPLEEAYKIVDLPGVNAISLQIPKMTISSKYKIHDYTDHIHDFNDTARLMKALDLIVTVDTSVAHLAGALGCPVWNLVRFNGYWPWLKDQDKSFWYNSMKIYRQPELGDWPSVIERARADLAELVMRKAA